MRARLLVAAVLVLSSIRTFAAITGTVVDADGRAVAGATISAFALDERTKPLATAKTDAKGNFSIDVNAPVVELRVEARSERVAANEDAGVLQIGVTPLIAATITADGKPLAGAVVSVDDTVTTTGPDGRYSLPDPKRIASRILVRHPDYAFAARLVAPFASTNANIAMTRGRSISGRVVAADGQTPVPNATIEVDGVELTKSAHDGTFTIAHAPANAKRVIARTANEIATSGSPLRLKDAARITGTVLDANARPLPGVEVMAKTPRVSETAGSAITDAKGNFAITGLEGGKYELTALHPEYSIPVLPVELTAGASLQRGLQAKKRAHVSGSVVDEERHPIAGARVNASAVSGPDGRYLLRVGEGELRLEASKRGFPSAQTALFRVAAGERKSGVTITIPSGVALAGRVIDRDRKPISGASVSTSENGEPVRTADDGTFTLRLKEGTYDLLVAAAGFASKSLRAQQVSARTEPLEITLDPGVEIRGRVTRGDEPVEGVTVFVTGSDAREPVQTGADGTFRIADLAPGELVLAFRKPADFIQLTRAVIAPANDVDVELPEGRHVSGRVIEKSAQQPVKSFSAGIGIMRAGTMRPPRMQSFASDDGTFAFDNVPAGSQTLVVTAPGFATARISIDRTENIEVALERGVRVSGHVTGPNDAALANVTVRVEAVDGVFTLTDADGAYVLENVEPGETTIAFSSSGLLTARKTATLAAPSAEVDAKLAAGSSISGVVVTSGGGPIADASVSAFSAADPDGGKSATSDARGAFTIAGVAAGHYEMWDPLESTCRHASLSIL